jgi:hypothetical protein
LIQVPQIRNVKEMKETKDVGKGKRVTLLMIIYDIVQQRMNHKTKEVRAQKHCHQKNNFKPTKREE